MICSLEAREFVPFGRRHAAVHPSTLPQSRGSTLSGTSHPDPGLSAARPPLYGVTPPAAVALESWRLRSSGGRQEELYVSDRLVVWSRGGAPDAGDTVIRTFTVDATVTAALWSSFLLPVDEAESAAAPLSGAPPPIVPSSSSEMKTVAAKAQVGVTVIHANTASVYTTDGRDYSTTLPFQVSAAWSVHNGLLLERAVPQPPPGRPPAARTPHKDSAGLPVLFSLLHPLDEATPVICRTGPAKVAFVTDTSQQIVYTHPAQPSLLVTYDRILRAHSVWAVRSAKAVEAATALGAGDTPLGGTTSVAGPEMSGLTPMLSSQSASGFSRFSQSPSCSSPLLRINNSSRINSPGSRLHSPSLSRLALSRTGSPGSSLYRLQTPSPGHRASPGGRTPMSATGHTLLDSSTDVKEPLVPEVCLDHLWTEGAGCRPDTHGPATRVFLTQDVVAQQYLAYVLSYCSQLRLVKFNESNDKTQLIFGSMSVVAARDAVDVADLGMMLVLDLSYHLVLYSGLTKVKQVHVGGLPDPHNFSLAGGPGGSLDPNNLSMVSGPAAGPSEPQQLPSTPSGSPVRLSLGPTTSSRPPSALEVRFFTDDLQRLSPVANSLLEDDFSVSHLGQIVGIRDGGVGSSFTLQLSDGRHFRASMPALTRSPAVCLCLDAIKQVLPKDLASQVLVKWYSASHCPGSSSAGQSEWQTFTKCLLALLGYDVDHLGLTRLSDQNDSSCSPVTVAKRLKPSDCDEDWLGMLRSDLHQHVSSTEGQSLGLEDLEATPHCVSETAAVDHTAALFPHFPALLFSLHLVYEELKLDALSEAVLGDLAALLCQMARDLRCELYTDHYSRDHPDLFAHVGEDSLILEEHFQLMHRPSFFSQTPPSIYGWLSSFLQGSDGPPAAFPYLYGVSVRTVHVVVMYVSLLDETSAADVTWSDYLRKVATAGHHSLDIEETISRFSPASEKCNPYERVVLYMAQLDASLRDSIQPGVALPLKEAIFRCRDNPPGHWPEQAYCLVGREDLAKQKRVERECPLPVTRDQAGLKEDEDGMETVHRELLGLQYSEDRRVEEARNLLQSSRPVRVAIAQRPEISDHEFIEEQEKHLYCICVRTMALAVGRGMFSLSTYHPVPTETVPVPKLCLSGRAPPRNTTVDLSHIDTPNNMTHWPLFHNGVAAGLRIANSSQLDSAWIMYNRPKTNELTNEHAGFLMGLGMNGHLRSLATLNVHDYLVRGHEMTSIGLLLGRAAGKRGTMDATTNRLLSIHVSALLPPTSTELDVPHNVQVAAIMGIGLLYQTTANRHIAEVLLQEIGRPPGPEMKNCTDCESYSLASGLALGLVMLGKGSEEMALSELNMADQLYHYMVGGQKRPLTGAYRDRYKSPSYQIKEGDAVNVDVTAPGATLALGLMFFNTSNSAVAEWLAAPDTQFLLDFVRPDFLLLRVISRGLVMWAKVQPTVEWIDSNLPEIVSTYAFKKISYANDPDCDVDFETMSQAYCNIVAGACVTLGLKFAGTANEAAFECLFEMVRKVLKLISKPLLVEQAGKTTVETCLICIVMSLALVVAGTGNLQVLRLCRHLRARVGQSYSHVLYGSHMAISMSIGLLFLGGGRYTLSSTPEAVAILLCAFFPKFPIHSNDNRYHLQALRHLYVLASQPRVLLPRDVSTGKPCYVPLEITFITGQTYQIMAPWFLPEVSSIKEVRVLGPRYWPISFQRDKNWASLVSLLSGSGELYVKQRAGHLSYASDPKGYHSVFAKCLLGEMSLSRSIRAEDIKSFSSDPRILAFAEYFCSLPVDSEYDMLQFLSRVLYECVSREKLDVLPYYISLQSTVSALHAPASSPSSLRLWQLKLLRLFYHRADSRLISPEYVSSLCNDLQQKLSDWSRENVPLLLAYFSGRALDSGDCRRLAAYLSWHNVPHPAILGQLGITPGGSLPQLYTRLKGVSPGLGLSDIMAIATTLQMCV